MLGSARKSVSLTQGTACAKPTWCEIPRHIKTTPNVSIRMEMKLYPEHHEEPLKDFNWGTTAVDVFRIQNTKEVKKQWSGASLVA